MSSQRLSTSYKHHQSVLTEMIKFFELENLTDVSLECRDGVVCAHRKILCQVSPLVRKLSSSSTFTSGVIRMHLIFPVNLFLSIRRRLSVQKIVLD